MVPDSTSLFSRGMLLCAEQIHAIRPSCTYISTRCLLCSTVSKPVFWYASILCKTLDNLICSSVPTRIMMHCLSYRTHSIFGCPYTFFSQGYSHPLLPMGSHM